MRARQMRESTPKAALLRNTFFDKDRSRDFSTSRVANRKLFFAVQIILYPYTITGAGSIYDKRQIDFLDVNSRR